MTNLRRMRKATALLLLVAACGSKRTHAVAQAGPEPALDAGASSDAGPDGGFVPDSDAGPDGGSVPDSDAGPPPANIDAMPCPGTPPTLWSRTITNLQADFFGAADQAGNLYWVEYQPATYTTPIGPAWLVSTNGDGNERYRARLSAYSERSRVLLAGGKVLFATPVVVSAYDAATGAPSWSIDLSQTYRANPRVTGITDLGNGEIAFGMRDDATANRVYLADLSTGAIVWSGSGVAVQASNGAGSAIVVVSLSGGYSPQGVFWPYTSDVLAIDGTGRSEWRHVLGTRSALSWNGAPWFAIPGTNGISLQGDYVAVPGDWFSQVSGGRTAFAISAGPASMSPDLVKVIQDDRIVSQGTIAGTDGFHEPAVFPFLCGGDGDHVLLVAQVWHSIPALCHPDGPGGASIARFNATSSWQCPLQFGQESAITGAAMLPGRLVVGHQLFDAACGSWTRVQPVTIEAYAFPNESLARSGWVQAGGSPGLGQRPLMP
jgi:hypothetical protein